MYKFFIILLTLCQLSYADNKPTCKDIIDACDKALDAKDSQIKIRDLGLSMRDDQITGLKKDNADLEHSLSAWYRSPYLYLFLGLATGVFVSSKL